MADNPTPPMPRSERSINLTVTETEANQLAFLIDTALKSPTGGVRVLNLAGHFMNKISQAMESGIVLATASDLPKPPPRG